MARFKATFEVDLPDAEANDPYDVELMAEDLANLVNSELLLGVYEVDTIQVEEVK